MNEEPHYLRDMLTNTRRLYHFEFLVMVLCYSGRFGVFLIETRVYWPDSLCDS